MKYSILFCFLFSVLSIYGQVRITPTEAVHHVGDSVTVQGTIYGGHRFVRPGQPTLLYLGDTTVGQPLLLFIDHTDSHFSDSLFLRYVNKDVVVNGKVSLLMKVPKIHLFDSRQIK